MTKFCKGADVVEAFRWTANAEQTEDPQWIVNAIKSGSVTFADNGCDTVMLRLRSPHGTYTANPGEWLIRYGSGRIVVSSAEEFHRAFRKQNEFAMCE